MSDFTPEQIADILSEHGKWLRGQGGSRANLSRANLSRANLYGANLSRANLSRANLYGANLYGANLSRANLDGANLSRANLYGANLSRANLYGANLYGANLYGANLSRANLYGANLYGANLPAILQRIYDDREATRREVRAIIEAHPERHNQSQWHHDAEWRNGTAKAVNECGTAHCLGGWSVHVLALKFGPLILDLEQDLSTGTLAAFALGTDAATQFGIMDNKAVRDFVMENFPEQQAA